MTDREAAILIALRPGPLEFEQLAERLGESLIDRTWAGMAQVGWIKREKTDQRYVYRITDEGRKVCPTRRTLAIMAGLRALTEFAEAEAEP